MEIKIGSQFEQYSFVKKLGEGGMGVVYLAHDLRLNRDVALKILPHTLSQDPGFIGRFEREAKTIAKLEHPAIIPLYDYGEFNGQPYLTMRFMRGGTLAERLVRERLSLTEVDNIMQRICDALEKAHENKIIHRDLKPANILFDEDGRAYLSDFGIARIAESSQTITIIGTPQYMSPEQALGHVLDASTDIYQMGIVLFQMLTGSVPYEAPTAPALLYQHVHAPIPSVEEMDNRLPKGCDQVIAKAIAKEKKERYKTAGELAASFTAIIAYEAVPQELSFAPTIIEEDLTSSLSSQHRYSRWLWWVGGASLLVFGLFLFFILLGDSQSNSGLSKITAPTIATITETALKSSGPINSTSTKAPDQTATAEMAMSTLGSPSPMPSKTTTPTRFLEETSELDLLSLPIPIDSIENASMDYANFPSGRVELGGIPFILSPRIFKSQALAESAITLPTNATIPLDIDLAQRVHLLLAAGNGFDRYLGAKFGRIEVQCNESREIIAELELGRNIREWHFAENVVSSAPETTEVWQGPVVGFPNEFGHIDLLSIDLPPACQEGHLTTLEIIDSSSETIQSLDPAINFFGLTVDYLH